MYVRTYIHIYMYIQLTYVDPHMFNYLCNMDIFG
jgi:hypothetical protein